MPCQETVSVVETAKEYSGHWNSSRLATVNAVTNVGYRQVKDFLWRKRTIYLRTPYIRRDDAVAGRLGHTTNCAGFSLAARSHEEVMPSWLRLSLIPEEIPPSMPWGLLRFDPYNGCCEFEISTKRGGFTINEHQSLSHTRWRCKCHVVYIPKRRKKRIFGPLRCHLAPALSGDTYLCSASL